MLIEANSKPCGVIVLTSGNLEMSKDDITQANMLANKLGLPLTQICRQVNTMQNEGTGFFR